MANELDELNGPVNKEGRDVAVIEKQLPIKVGVGSTIFQIILDFPRCQKLLPVIYFLHPKPPKARPCTFSLRIFLSGLFYSFASEGL